MTLPDSTRRDWQHALLPVAAVRLLQQSAITPITVTDPLARQKAIDAAIARVKRTWPQYFRDRT